MDRLIKLYLSSVFLVLIYSCSSIEIEEAAIMVAVPTSNTCTM
jgi:hypothetical protein